MAVNGKTQLLFLSIGFCSFLSSCDESFFGSRLTKGNLDASEKSKKDGAESNNLLNEASSVKETMDVFGFQILPSQV